MDPLTSEKVFKEMAEPHYPETGFYLYAYLIYIQSSCIGSFLRTKGTILRQIFLYISESLRENIEIMRFFTAKMEIPSNSKLYITLCRGGGGNR